MSNSERIKGVYRLGDKLNPVFLPPKLNKLNLQRQDFNYLDAYSMESME